MARYRTIFALNIGVFLMMTGVGTIMARLPLKMLMFTGSPSSVGYLATVFAAFYLLLQVPIGRLADRIGFRLLIGAGFAVCGLSGIIYYHAAGSAMLLIGRALQGMGEVPVWALAPALLSILYPQTKGRIMGFYNASFHLGLSAGPFAGILLHRHFKNPDAPIFYYIAASFSAALLIWLLSENPVRFKHQKTKRADIASVKQIINSKRIRIILAGIVLYGAGYGYFVTLIPAYLISSKNFSAMEIGMYFTLFYIAISLVQLAAGPLSDRWERAGFMIAGNFLAALGIALFPIFGKAGILCLLTASGFGLGMFFVTSMALLNETANRDQKGTVSGIYFLCWGSGYFLGPLIAGMIGKTAGLESCFAFYGGLLILVAVLMFWWRKN